MKRIAWLLAAWMACAPVVALERWQSLPPTPQLPASSSAGIAPVNGIQMYFARFGAGEPVLLLHGGFANADYWGNIIPALVARHFEVIVADSRGHGRSTRSDSPLSYRLMSSDVLALIDYLHLPRVDLVGWSDGGIIGLELAMQHPERLHRLAVYGANGDPSGVRADVETQPVFAAYLERTRSEYQRLSPTPRDYDRFVAEIGHMWANEPHFSETDLALIRTPTLVFDGAHDEAIKREHSAYLARTIPGASLVILKDVSHFGMLQNPDEFAATFIRFLLDR